MPDQIRRIVAVFSAKNEAAGQMAAFRRDLDKSTDAVSRMARGTLALAGVGGGLYALKYGVQSSIREYAAFEKQMAMVSTMLDDQAMNLMPQYKEQVRDMAKRYGEGTETISRGLYDILSASIAPSKAMDVLTVSLKAARAGITDTAIAADAITTVLNSYGWQAEQAGMVSDKLFAIVKKGKTTFADLAPNIGKVAAIAAQANISFDDLGAATATLTRSGLQTELAMTGLRSMITQFLKPSDDARKLARQFGFELDTTTLKAIGLTGVMQKLKGITAEQLAVLMPNVRGMAGFAIAVNSAAEMMEDYEFITRSAGQTQEAFNKMAETTDMRLARLEQRWKALKVTIGENLVIQYDYINDTLNALKEIQEIQPGYMPGWGPHGFELFPPARPKGGLPEGKLEISPRGLQRIAEMRAYLREAAELQKELRSEPVAGVNVIISRPGLAGLSEAQQKAAKSMYEMTMRARGLTDELKREKEITEFAALAKTRYGDETDEAAASIAAFKETLKESEALKEQEKLLAERADAYRHIYSQMGRMTEDVYEAQMAALEELARDYERVGVSVQSLTAWYKEQAEVIEIEYLKAAGGAAGGFTAASMQIRRDLKTAGDKAYEFSMAFRDSIASGLERSRRDFDNWKAHLLNIFEEIYWAAIRIALIQPGATALAGGMTAGLGALFGAKAPVGVSTKVEGGAMWGAYQHGGIAWRPQLAMVGEVPEAFVPLSGGRSIPVQLRGGDGVTKFDFHMHNEGSEKLEITDVETYLLSDQRIVNVTMQAMQTNIAFRRSIKEASR